jgi:hypothetical protein
MTSDGQPSKDLLSLPFEIRHKIWGYALNSEVTFCQKPSHWKSKCCDHSEAVAVNGTPVWRPDARGYLPNPHLGLLLTSRTVYEEVSRIPRSTSLLFPDLACVGGSILSLWAHGPQNRPRWDVWDQQQYCERIEYVESVARGHRVGEQIQWAGSSNVQKVHVPGKTPFEAHLRTELLLHMLKMQPGATYRFEYQQDEEIFRGDEMSIVVRFFMTPRVGKRVEYQYWP